ncbi:MAG: thioredoxin domain-containing protein [Burkholderiales bacterium]
MIRLLIAVCVVMFAPSGFAAESKIEWQPWSDKIFEQAKRENKFVLLDLEAVWCHWCHVMDDKTYRDPEVVKLIESRYIAVKVDQDANPDLSNRYEDYGWPATVVFAADGSELVKRRGYLPPQVMASMLDEIIKDPSPGPSVRPAVAVQAATSAHLADKQREKLLNNYFEAYDKDNAGWGTVHKFIQAQNMEYALVKAKEGDRKHEAMARATLDAALNLMDPVWGGMYQYSDEVNWKSPHFEKIMSIQADNLRLYSQAYALFDESRYLQAARDIERYLANFLMSPEGVFYTSQNADVNMEIDGKKYYPLADAERRKLGMPRIDKNIYSRENGWAIRGLTALYDVTGDPKVLARAKKAADWVVANRGLEGGGFSHGEKDRAGPFLGDTLAMAEAFLALHASTGERDWLKKAEGAARFIAANFKHDSGFKTTRTPPAGAGVFQEPVRQIDENLNLARFANLLSHYTGKSAYRDIAEHALKYLGSPAIAGSNRFLAALLLADREFVEDPAHITVVGAKTDAEARALHGKALQYPAIYRRIEWWDRSEGALANPDVEYPEMEQAAAYICVNKACSLPIFNPGEVIATADRLLEIR